MIPPTFSDLAYAEPEPGDSAGHLLDLYLPERREAPAPLVIWSSGSAWLRDDGKHGAAAVAPFFTKKGYAVAGISVRSSAQARFPAQLHDAKAAVRWLRLHAADHCIDSGRFAIMGNSSGGWLAAMVALTEHLPTLEGTVGSNGTSSQVHVAVDFFGPTDFLQMDAHMIGDCQEFRTFLGIERCHDDPKSPESLFVGGPIETRRDACASANPVTYVHPDAPPLMILHGQADPFVPHHQSELLYEAMRESRSRAVFYSIPGIGHELPYVTDAKRAAGYVVSSTLDPSERPAPTWETIEVFVADALSR